MKKVIKMLYLRGISDKLGFAPDKIAIDEVVVIIRFKGNWY